MDMISSRSPLSSVKRNIKAFQEHGIEVNVEDFAKLSTKEQKAKLKQYLLELQKKSGGLIVDAPFVSAESTIYHEMFHALSRKAVLKREKYLNFFASTILGQKQLSVREFEEGMTEYLNSCICGEVAKNVRFSYSQVTTIVNKLAKIYGDEIILEYYLGFNTNLIDEMNKDQPNNFKNVVQLCQKVDSNGEQPVAFEASKYYKKNGDVVFDDLLFNLFSKKKLKKVTSIEDFKYNVKQLLV